MRVTVNRHSGVPLYRQIAGEIRSLILGGHMVAGYRLPPERSLAHDLGVNRATVMQAYDQLRSEGLIVSMTGRGTFVRPERDLHDPQPTADAESDRVHTSPPWPILFSDYSNRFTYHDIASANMAQDPGSGIDFATGSPNPKDIPDDLLRRISSKAFASHAFDGKPESPIEGFDELRELLAARMSQRGVSCGASNIMVLSGSEQGIDLCVRTLINPGDVILTEESTFFPALQAFRSAQARIVGVPTDGDGIRIDMLEAYCSRLHPKMIYTIPTFQNPTGRTLPAERRRALVETAIKHQCLILEDDPYGDLRYEGETPIPLAGMENSGYVIYLSTFSKTVAPALRTGWIEADGNVISRLAALRRMIDQRTSASSQRICIELLRGDTIDRHVSALVKTYRRRRDLMEDALRRHAPRGMTWHDPHGGYYVWARLPEGVRAETLLRACRADGVTFMPGAIFSVEAGDDRHIRLNFARPDTSDVARGIGIVCAHAARMADVRDE